MSLFDNLPMHDPADAYRQMGCEDCQDEALLREITADALRDIPPKLAEVLEAMESNESYKAGILLHSIKGTVSCIGVPAFFEAVKKAESSARAGDMERLPDDIAWLYEHWAHLEIGLRAWLDRRSE